MSADPARHKYLLAAFVVVPLAITLALEVTYRRAGLGGLGLFVTMAFGVAVLCVAVAALTSLVLSPFWRGSPPLWIGLPIATLWLIAVFAIVLPSIHVLVIENRWVSHELPLLDPVVLWAAKAPVDTTLPALLDHVPESARRAALRADLQRLSRTDGRVLAVSGSSWGRSYKFNVASHCWEAWDEDVLINPYVRYVAP